MKDLEITVDIATVPIECRRCARTVFPFADVYRIGRVPICSGCFHAEQSKRRAAARKRSAST